MKKTANIMFLIYPISYKDISDKVYDVIAVGDCSILLTLVKKYKHFHLIKKSKFGGVSVLVMDTCDTLKDAMSCIKTYRKLYELKC